MPHIQANGIEIFYDEFGSQDAPPVLLIMGFTAQMISWDEGFCELLAGKGFRVIRFDNRDVGLSAKTQGPLPKLTAPATPGGILGLDGGPPYTLSDMAEDAVGVLDALGIDKAHIVGASMGGMIAQRLTLNHPDRVLSLTSIMSTTGNAEVGQATGEALTTLLTPAPTEREAYIEHAVKTGQVISGPLFDADRTRARAGRGFDRCFHPAGAAFQLAAILADGDRTEQLGSITAPTIVIHGADDPLVTPSGGEATAAAIPGAELVILDRMGHDQPPELWEDIASAIAKVAAAASVA
jgi:pimeloyl-ACP methyl ester carboxylesterase